MGLWRGDIQSLVCLARPSARVCRPLCGCSPTRLSAARLPCLCFWTLAFSRLSCSLLLFLLPFSLAPPLVTPSPDLHFWSPHSYTQLPRWHLSTRPCQGQNWTPDPIPTPCHPLQGMKLLTPVFPSSPSLLPSPRGTHLPRGSDCPFSTSKAILPCPVWPSEPLSFPGQLLPLTPLQSPAHMTAHRPQTETQAVPPSLQPPSCPAACRASSHSSQPAGRSWEPLSWPTFPAQSPHLICLCGPLSALSSLPVCRPEWLSPCASPCTCFCCMNEKMGTFTQLRKTTFCLDAVSVLTLFQRWDGHA